MTSLVELARKAEKFTFDNSPLILTAVGAAGVVTTAVLAAQGGMKAQQIIADRESVLRAKREASVFEAPKLTLKEKLVLTWPCYVPACATGVTTITAIVGANQIGNRRAAAMAAAMSVSEKAFEEYKEKVKEKWGAQKEQQVRDDVQQDRVNRDYEKAGGNEVIIMVGKQLCYDSLSGRFFESTVEDIKQAVNRLNHRVVNDNYASLTDFYDFVGLDRTAESDEIGWNVDELLDVHLTTCLSPDGRPAIAMEYKVVPVRGYFRLH